jgi:hypothetical protein
MALLYNPTYLRIHDLTGEESKPLAHPEGDYPVLNDRISHLEHLIASNCPELKSEIYLSFDSKRKSYSLQRPAFDGSPSYVCYLNDNTFFENSQDHEKFLLYPVNFLIEHLEIKYLAHPLRAHKNIYYDKMLCTGETDYTRQSLIQVHGNFSQSQVQIEQTLEMLNLLPYEFSIHIEYTESPHYDQYYFTATVKNPEHKSIAQTGTINFFKADEVESFNNNAEVMDKYMAQVYQSLNKSIAQCQDYTYYKAKLDLYNSLDEHIENLPEPDENSMPKVKI